MVSPTRRNGCTLATGDQAQQGFNRAFADVATTVYTSAVTAARRAKLFQNGGSQAVRLPRECRFPEGSTEVLVRRVGRKVILEPPDEWSEAFLRCLGSIDEELERPKSPPITKLRDPFA